VKILPFYSDVKNYSTKTISRVQRAALVALCFLLSAGASFAQGQAQASTPPPTATPDKPAVPAANPADVASPDAIMAATYDVISGPAGQKRDWDRMRSLFYPGARLIRTASKKEGGMSATSFSVQEYIDRASVYFEKNGFWEREIARRTEKWGNILQAFSTYESRHDAKDATPFVRGINSFQLFFDGTRWWVITIYWQEETPENPLPAEFLPHSHG
jgi:hypothetical protein